MSNRDPVICINEVTVDGCLKRLQSSQLAQTYFPAGSRVAKFQHTLREVFTIDNANLAVLTILLWRGSQTAGEITELKRQVEWLTEEFLKFKRQFGT